MKVPLLDLKPQYQIIKDQIEPAMLALMESQQFVLGRAVSAFESHIARYCSCTYALGVSSGTDALLCALMALGIKAGDEVIVPVFTFFGSAGAVARTGARPVFIDIDPATFNLDVSRLDGLITPRTRAIMPVHLFGQMAPMQPIMEIARRHDLAVIEDACQSIGTRQDGITPGQISTCACLSFYPSKNLSGFGDGGLILTQDANFDHVCRSLRVHGESSRYYHDLIGGNFRLDAIQALACDIKLPHLDGWVELRRRHAAIYDRLLAEPVVTPYVAPGNISVCNQYVIRAPRRDELQKYLADREIGSGIYYPVPLHLQRCFGYLGYTPGDFPAAEAACREVLALPVFPELSDEQIEFVAKTVNDFYR